MRLAFLLTTVAIFAAATAYPQDMDWVRLAEFTTGLSFRLQPHYGRQQENVIYSPLAISTSLAMIYKAASYQLAQHFQKDFNLNFFDDINQAYHDYYQKHHDFTWAYGVHIDQKHSILYSYQQLLQRYYQTPIHRMDFSHGDESRRQINQYVKTESNGKFPEYLEKNLDPQTQLYYLSAAYYAGTLKYHTGQSYTGQFHIHGDQYKQVSFWTIRGPLYYFNFKEYTALRIPFHDNDNLSLFLIITENYSLEKIKEIYTIMDFSFAWTQMQLSNVEVHLPRLSLEYYQPLSDVFESSGFNYMFEEGADFFGLTSMYIHLSQVDHRAYFELKDPIIQDYESHYSHDHTVKFDHPFLFYVVDHNTAMIHFSGFVNKP